MLDLWGRVGGDAHLQQPPKIKVKVVAHSEMTANESARTPVCAERSDMEKDAHSREGREERTNEKTWRQTDVAGGDVAADTLPAHRASLSLVLKTRDVTRHGVRYRSPPRLELKSCCGTLSDVLLPKRSIHNKEDMMGR